MENNDVTLIAFNEVFKELEKTNKKLNRVKFMNKVYFGFACIWALALYDQTKEQIKKLERKMNETE